jgi:hypothetical protein
MRGLRPDFRHDPEGGAPATGSRRAGPSGAECVARSSNNRLF